MLKKIKEIKGSAFVKNIAYLSGGTLAGQFISTASLPILTRLYSPDLFGVLAVYMSAIMVLSVAACLRLDLAVPLPNTDSEAASLVVLGIASATLISIGLLFAAFIWPVEVSEILQEPSLENYLWMIPLGVWLASTYSALQFWAIRKKRFATVASTQLTRAAGSSGIQIAWGYFSPSGLGLMMGYMLYGGLGSLGLLRSAWKNDRHIFYSINLGLLKSAFIKWRRYPIFSTPEALLNSAAVNLPIVLIATFATASDAGHLLLAQRVASIPVGLLGSSLSRVFLSESREKALENNLGKFARRIMWNLLRLSFFPFLIMAVFSPFAFPLVFGADWTRAGIMVLWLTPAMFFQFLVSPVSTVLHVYNRHHIALALQAFGFTFITGAIIFASFYRSEKVFEAFAVSAAIYYLIYLVVVIMVTGDKLIQNRSR